MKVLCTTLPAHGHFRPMVPLARALAAAGHTVTVATAPELHAEVRGAGLVTASAGIGYATMEARLAGLAHDASIPVERQRTRMTTEIAPAAMLHDLRPLVEDADIVLHEEGEHAGPIAAALAGVPCVTHGWPAPLMSGERAARIGAAVAPLWRQVGLVARPLFRQLYIDCCPAALQSPRIGELSSQPIRPMAESGPSADHAPWLAGLVAPIVYVTSGTVATFSRLPGLFEEVLDGLRDEPVELVVTVGPHNDPALLARRFPRAHVSRYLAQAELLPRCDLVICHGGAGTTTAALRHGIPVLVLPRGAASQQRIAAACQATGVGRTLASDAITPRAIRDAARALLDDARYRVRASQVANEIATMPAPEVVVRVVEREVELHRRGARAPIALP